MTSDTRKCLLILVAAILLGGCEPQLAPPPITLDTQGVRPQVDYLNLAVVLDEAATENGRLIASAIGENEKYLTRQLRLLAVTGPTATPELFPNEASRIAYWYNARAAWAMKLAEVCDCPKQLRRQLLTDRAFPLDARQMSLDAIDAELAKFNDWRILVAAPGVTLRRAPLPSEPFHSEDVMKRIDARLSGFVDDPRRFVMDVARQEVVIPRVIWNQRQTIIRDYQQAYDAQGATLLTALLPHLNLSATRRVQDAIGYKPVPGGKELTTALAED